MKRILGVIPARIESTRLPRKMLVEIAGKPLLYYTWRQAKKAKLLDEVIIATPSFEIKKVMSAFSDQVIMTSLRNHCGSDAVAEAVKKYKKFKPQTIVNVQGDEPIISPNTINSIVKTLLENKTADMVTAAVILKNEEDLVKPNIVKVVVDKNNYALYFSRSLIPFPRNKYNHHLRHLGIFGFQKKSLFKYVKLKQTSLELAESLEPLRFLENGYKIKIVVGNFYSISVDTPEDLVMARSIIEKNSYA